MRNAIKNEPINRLSTKLYMKFTRLKNQTFKFTYFDYSKLNSYKTLKL